MTAQILDTTTTGKETPVNIQDAIILAEHDATDAIEIARCSHEPVAFITDNAYFPALRGFGRAEMIWQADGLGDVWDAYVDTFEGALDAADVLLGSPDCDNALYVVDLRRWQPDDDDDEWEPIAVPAQ